MDFSERLRRLNDAIERGEVIRSLWTSEHGGRKLACLLATLAPEVVEGAAAGDVTKCPADVMPTWFAHLVPWIDDAGTEGAWRGNVDRFAALLAYPGYRRLDWPAFRERVLDACVAEAELHRDKSPVGAVGADHTADIRRGYYYHEEHVPLRTAFAAAGTAWQFGWNSEDADRLSAEAADRIIAKILNALQFGCEEAVR